MPIPSFVGVGAQAQTANAGGAGPVTPGLPAGIAVDDILILGVEAANEPVNAVSGWTPVGSGAVVQATGLVTDLTARWLRYTGSETAPSVSITGANHVIARIAAFRGCVATGSPINGTPAVNADNGVTTAFSIPGGTTTATDCLILAMLSTGTDITSTTMATGWTSTTTFSPALTEFFDNWHVTGNGGGFAAAYGGRAASGAYNAITGTLTTGNTKATMSFALQGATAAAAGAPPNPHPVRSRWHLLSR